MRSPFTQIIRRLTRDESGAAVTEYAVAIGLVVLAVTIVLTLFGAKVLARWENLADKLDGQSGSTVVTATARRDH
jgi:Flp pilus assembly pilin Flp